MKRRKGVKANQGLSQTLSVIILSLMIITVTSTVVIARNHLDIREILHTIFGATPSQIELRPDSRLTNGRSLLSGPVVVTPIKEVITKNPKISQKPIATNTISDSVTFDVRGFVMINEQKVFPIGWPKENGGNFKGVLSGRWENGSNLDELFKTGTAGYDMVFATPYGDAMQSFTCSTGSGLDQSDGVNGQAGRCVTCTKLNTLCPYMDSSSAPPKAACNYCNPDYYSDLKDPGVAGASDFLEEIKDYRVHGFYFDEPGNAMSSRDKRYYDILDRIKKADQSKIVAGADNLHCEAEKRVDNKGKTVWELQTQFAGKLSPYRCAGFYKDTTKASLEFFTNPNVDIISAESGYFPRLKPGQTGSSHAYVPPRRDDIQQLIGTMEYFRQEVRSATGKKKPVIALLQYQDIGAYDEAVYEHYRPSFNEIRSMVYVALGHQTRGLWFYANPTSDPEYTRARNDITHVIAEIKNEGVLRDFMDPSARSNTKHVASSNANVDVSSFYTRDAAKNKANYYLIIANLKNDNPAQNVEVTIPRLEQDVEAKVIGEGRTRRFEKGKTTIYVDLAPHQTKVFMFPLTPVIMQNFAPTDVEDY